MPDQPKKILIAEDEKPMANALKFKLTKSGFDVFVAFNGQEALDLIKKEKIDLKPDFYRYYGEKKTKKFFLELIR